MLMNTNWRGVQILTIALLATVASRLAAEENIEISGVVETIQGNRLQVQSGERRWVVVVDSELLKELQQRTAIEFHGRGRGSILERGLWVRFFADVDATGKVVGALGRLTWFTPDRYTREGAFPAKPRDEGGEPIVDWERPQRGEIVAGHYLIVGSVRSARSGHLLVIYLEDGEKERQVHAQLAPDVDIEIAISNKEVAGSMLKPGDAVAVRGRPRENQLHALSIVARREAVMGKPLAKQPEPRRPPRSDDDDDAGEDEPVAAVEPAPTDRPPVDDDANPFGVALGEPDGDAEPAADVAKPTRARILKVN